MPRMRLVVCLALALVTFATGCLPDWFRRTSTSEKPPDLSAPKLPELKTVGDYTAFGGVEPVRVFGVGVVEGLSGTGSNPPPGPARQQAIHDLKRLGVDRPDEFLASKNAAMVMVSAIIPAGVRKDDRLDVLVEVMPDDKSTSLKGGSLIICDLHEYVDANAARGKAKDGQRMMADKKMAKAEGPIVLGVGDDGAKNERQRQGRVWGGGRVLKERGFDLILNKNNQSAGLAMAIAKAVNDRYHAPDASGKRVVAEAMNGVRIALRAPDQYRLNWPRYLRTMREIPLGQSPPLNKALIEKLGQELQDPTQCVHAALQLEALGQDSIPVLKRGIQAVHPLSRFCAAEALAYLGDPACGEPLAELIKEHAEFRAYGLTALASLDEAVCHLKLRELLHASQPETRYGAFRALRMLSENDTYVRGEQLPGGFWLHRLPSQTPSLVHVSTSQRAEVVIFGEEPMLQPPFSFRAGADFVVTAKEGDESCIISRYSVKAGRGQKTCSLKATDIVATLGKMGAGYGDVVDLMQQAADCKTLAGGFAVDALPQAQPLETVKLDGENATPAKADLGDTPNLFSKMGRLLTSGEPK